LRRAIFAALLALAVYASRGTWLSWMGEYLVDAEQPQPAEIAVVLGGDGYGHRIMKAVELVRAGLAPKILVDGPVGYYGVAESDLAIPFAVKRGAPPEYFEPFPITARATFSEAQAVDEELQKRGIRKALVVTSNFHTRRARRMFEQHGSGKIEYHFIAAPHPDFSPGDWWHTREGKKIVAFEYLKTLNSWFE
jgi:uncharacterized SAM-binding protein YcdF (DUF218 family)